MPTLNKMQLWLRDYERSRHSKQPNESWANSKYNTGDWRESQQIRLASGLTVGQSFHKLKKLWSKYKIAGRDGSYRGDTAYKINQTLAQLDLPTVPLPELEGLPDYEFENQDQDQTYEPEQDLSIEEIQQLKREEQEDDFEWADWNRRDDESVNDDW
jgi:hypothetical protein